ncbi:MAG: hypothetical protein JXR86_18100 [Spirochaetales bacterium]|nr:hypothetical protein [Spirochaetales bacterium]
MAEKDKKQLCVVSHTHWDREWYQSFQNFRYRFIDMMDELLDHLDAEPEYRFFHLDGQTVLLEDYLSIRPDNKERLMKFVEEGRILIGPWYVMPDLFIPSGEALVRNLRKGLDQCRIWNAKPLNCGYVVDMFGHPGQMPQIFRQCGLESAMLIRGVGDFEKDQFMWEGVDGTEIHTFKLDKERTYGNFYFGVRWPFDDRSYEKEELIERARFIAEYAGSLSTTPYILLMDGVDHIEIEPELSGILGTLNEELEDYEWHHCSLNEYIENTRSYGKQLDVIRGELYSVGRKGVNNLVLKNVLSSQARLKRLNSLAENSLTGWAEPLSALSSLAGDSFREKDNLFLEKAWEYLLKNHFHDSIGGCSISEVHKDNEYRYRQVLEISENIIRRTMERICLNIDSSSDDADYSMTIFNMGQQEINGLTEVILSFPSPHPVKFRIFDSEGREVPYQISNRKLEVTTGSFRYRRLPSWRHMDDLKAVLPVKIRSFGYTTFLVKIFEDIRDDKGDYSWPLFHPPVRYPGSMKTGEGRWENDFYILEISDSNKLTLRDKETGRVLPNILCFEDDGDIGDGWNYVSLPQNSSIVTTGAGVHFEVEADGLHLLRLKIIQAVDIPESADNREVYRSERKIGHEIITRVSMYRDSRKLDFSMEIDNKSIEHRLRYRLYTSTGAKSFYTSTPFLMQKRPILMDDLADYQELETGVFPNQGTVLVRDSEGAVALYTDGIYEVSCDNLHEHPVALTLFRSFTKEVGRGKAGEVGRSLGKLEFTWALELFAGDINPAEVLVRSSDWKKKVRNVMSEPHCGSMAKDFSFFEVTGNLVVSSVRKVGEFFEIRLFNPDANASCSGELDFARPLETAEQCDLSGNTLKQINLKNDKRLALSLRAGEIMTLKIRPKD